MRNDREAVIARARRARGDLDESASAASPPRHDRDLVARVMSTIKRVCGMPDYPGYLRHMAEQHPGAEVVSERKFFEEHIQARYGGGATRCC